CRLSAGKAATRHCSTLPANCRATAAWRGKPQTPLLPPKGGGQKQNNGCTYQPRIPPWTGMSGGCGTILQPSCPGLCPALTSFLPVNRKGVDGTGKSGLPDFRIGLAPPVGYTRLAVTSPATTNESSA